MAKPIVKVSKGDLLFFLPGPNRSCNHLVSLWSMVKVPKGEFGSDQGPVRLRICALKGNWASGTGKQRRWKGTSMRAEKGNQRKVGHTALGRCHD